MSGAEPDASTDTPTDTPADAPTDTPADQEAEVVEPGVSDQEIVDHVPVFYFHSGEKYFPSDIRDYVDACSLLKDGKVIVKQKDMRAELITDPSVDPALGPPFEKNGNFRLRLDVEAARAGAQKEITGSGHQMEFAPPVYVYVNHVRDNLRTFTDLVFILTFPYNGTLDPHQFDAEFVCVRLQEKDGKNEPVGYYLSQHGGGMWHKPGELRSEYGRAVIFVALESHAVYVREGPHARFYGVIGNDYTDKGAQWIPSRVVRVPPTLEEIAAEPATAPMAFVGMRSGDSNQAFPPVQHPTASNSAFYECEEEHSDLLVNKAGETVDKARKIMVIVAAAAMAIMLALTVGVVVSEGRGMRMFMTGGAVILGSITTLLLAVVFLTSRWPVGGIF